MVKITNKMNKLIKSVSKRYKKYHEKVLNEILFVHTVKIFSRDLKSYVDENGIERFKEENLIGEYPCAIDFVKYGRITMAKQEEEFKTTVYATLFLNKDIEIPLNCRMEIVIENRLLKFERNGISNVYETHQEIPIQRSRVG